MAKRIRNNWIFVEDCFRIHSRDYRDKPDTVWNFTWDCGIFNENRERVGIRQLCGKLYCFKKFLGVAWDNGQRQKINYVTFPFKGRIWKVFACPLCNGRVQKIFCLPGSTLFSCYNCANKRLLEAYGQKKLYYRQGFFPDEPPESPAAWWKWLFRKCAKLGICDKEGNLKPR